MPDPREELQRRLNEPGPQQRLQERLGDEDGTTALGSFLVNLLKGVGDTAGSLIPATGDILAGAAAGIEGTARGLTPGGEGFEFQRRFREEQEKFPASAIRSFPRVTSNQLLAGGRAAAETPFMGGTEALSRNFAEQLESLEAADLQRVEEHPISSFLGDLGGTVASLLIAKRPLQGSIRRVEQRIVNPPALARAEAIKFTDDLNRAFRSSWVRLPARGLFRAGETGLEAAFLEVLSESENDPMLAAGLGAGAQVASSGLYGGLKSLLQGGAGSAAMKFTASAIAMGGLWQMVKSAAPGGEDQILDSIESGFDKTTYAVLLGVLGSAMGARGRGAQVSPALQEVIEGFTTIPRVQVLNLITEFAHAPEAEQALFGDTIDKVLANPNFAGESEQEKALVKRLREALSEE